MTAIEDFFRIYKDSAWHKDSAAMIDLYDEQAVVFDMWDRGFYSVAAEWTGVIKDWLSSLGEERVNVDFEMIKISQSQNLGFATALIKFQAISSDGLVLRSMKNRITIGFSKFEDGWRVIHQHTSAPVNSDGLRAIFDI